MKIPFNYLPFQFFNTSPYFKEWKKLIKSSEFTLGSYVENFEKTFANYVGAKHCISTNNGTDIPVLGYLINVLTSSSTSLTDVLTSALINNVYLSLLSYSQT